ncbi:MAG: PPC domain-containing DNA-binding protein [Bacillota bacterium]
MKYSQAQYGRIFIIRLEDGEILHETIESFAREKGIMAAALIAVGGADEGSRLVVGPAEGRNNPIRPMELLLDGVHEITGTGAIFPDKDGCPVLHMHAACGRSASAVAGCVRKGVKVWHVMEIIVFELTGGSARRLPDADTGFELLVP